MELLEQRQLLSVSPHLIAQPALSAAPKVAASTIDGFTPAQIQHAYGFDQIDFGQTAANGSGQTIAIVDAFDAPTILADLKTFDKQFGLANPPKFTKVGQTGNATDLPTVDAGWAQEAALDVEWAHAIAPKANLLLVEADSDSVTDLIAAVDTARKTPGVSVVSMSWGMDEFSNETSYDKFFSTPKGHVGVTFVAASGDDGAGRGATWPAVSRNVLAVGGTTLSLDGNGDYGSESAWRDSSGGTSRFETAPAYQSSLEAGSRRVAPDVSYDANPNTGFAIYDSLAYQGDVGWQDFGGTSAGTPQWAALVAIANQGRVLQGGKPLGGPTGTLPALYSLYAPSSTYSASYHDITTGGGGGGFGWWRRSTSSTTAKVGYDTITGLGSPKAQNIVATLVGAAAAAKPKVTATTAAKSQITAKAALAKNATVVNVAAAKLDLSVVPLRSLVANIFGSVSILSMTNPGLLTVREFSNQSQWRTLDSFAGLEASQGKTSADGLARPAIAANSQIERLGISPGTSDRPLRFFLFRREIVIHWSLPRFSAFAESPAATAGESASSTWIKRLTLMLASGVAIGDATVRGRARRYARQAVPSRRFSVFDR